MENSDLSKNVNQIDLTVLANSFLKNQEKSNEYEHIQELKRIESSTLIEKQRLEGQSEIDFRNKCFIGACLFITVAALAILAVSDKLTEGLLSIFSMMIGGLFTAYAAGLQIIGKNKSKSESDTE